MKKCFVVLSFIVFMITSTAQKVETYNSEVNSLLIDSIYSQFLKLREKYPCATLFCEDSMNAFGYKLVSQNRLEDALKAFKINTIAFPNSYNTYDSYAEALNISGRKDSAAFYYRKSLEIFPNSWTGYRGLKNLGLAPPSDTMAKLLEKMIPNDISYVPNITFCKGGNRDLRFSIIRENVKSSKPQPVLVYLHGGGWQEGIKETGVIPSIHFARRGYVCVVVEYRLSSEAIFPAQIEDAKCAIRYLKAHAKELNIDPNRIGAWGESAGGYLATMLGVTAGNKLLEGNGGWNKYNSNVKAVCEWSAATSFIDTKIKGAPTVPIDAVFRFFGGNPYEKKKLTNLATPSYHIDKNDAPVLILHGANDNIVRKEHAEYLYKALANSGVSVEMKIFPNEGHFASYGAVVGEISGGMPRIRIEMRRLMDEFFDKYLKY